MPESAFRTDSEGGSKTYCSLVSEYNRRPSGRIHVSQLNNSNVTVPAPLSETAKSGSYIPADSNAPRTNPEYENGIDTVIDCSPES
jgi:hypothetical protein